MNGWIIGSSLILIAFVIIVVIRYKSKSYQQTKEKKHIKKIEGIVKLQILAGKASPAPPIGSALSAKNINIDEFCRRFNEETKNMSHSQPLKVTITIYSDRTFIFDIEQTDETDNTENTENNTDNQTKKWYVIRVVSGKENKIIQSLKNELKQQNLENFFGEIISPTQTRIEVIRGKKIQKEVKFFPEYILIEMHLNNQTQSCVTNITGVIDFIGVRDDPTPFNEHEINRLKKKIKDKESTPPSSHNFEKGDKIKVTDGPFLNFIGTVENTDTDKGKIEAEINIYGRSTPVELDFSQIEKIDEISK